MSTRAFDLAVFDMDINGQNAATSFDLESWFLSDAMIVDVFGNAANTVAAHFGLGPIGVVHAHASVATFARTDQDHAIGPDSEVAIRNLFGECGGILGKLFLETVHINIVITARREV